MTAVDKSILVKQMAISLGFDLVGITSAGPLTGAGYYRNWLAAGYAGSMSYLTRNVPIREDPSRLWPQARSIICAAVSYNSADKGRSPPPTVNSPVGLISSYARGDDYHVVLRKMLERLADEIAAALGEDFEWRAFVDTGPLLERTLAAAAGLGWVGKHTLVLHPRLGSYLFLGELVTSLRLAPDEPIADHCGTCTRCLDACPTEAFPRPYVLDATRCISYLTIEHRGEVSRELAEKSQNWVYGCDICQEVCPFNSKAPPTRHDAFIRQHLPAAISLLDLLALDRERYRELTRGTAADRAKLHMWQRNAAIALGNQPRLSDEEVAALRQAAEHGEPSVQAAARNALARHGRGGEPC